MERHQDVSMVRLHDVSKGRTNDVLSVRLHGISKKSQIKPNDVSVVRCQDVSVVRIDDVPLRFRDVLLVGLYYTFTDFVLISV